MRDAGGATSAASRQMQTDLAELAGGSREAGSAVDEFVHHVRGMRREAFLGNFMAKQIAEMGLASKSAAGEVTGLVSAFALGGGIGLAIESVKLLVKEFTSGGAEIEKFTNDAINSVKDLQNKVDQYLAGLRGATEGEKLQHEAISKLLRQEADLKQDMIGLSIKVADKAAEAEEAENKHRSSAAQLALNERDAAVEEYNNKKKLLDITQEQIRLDREQVSRVDTADKGVAKQKAREQDEKTQETHNITMLQLAAQLVDGEEKITADYAVKLQQIRDNDKLSATQQQEEIAAVSEVYVKQIVDFRQKLDDADEKRRNEQLNRLIDAEAKAAEAMRKDGERIDKWRADLFKRESDRMKKQADEMTRDFERFGRQAVTSLVSIVDGTQSVTQAMTTLARQLATDVLDILVKIGAQTLANAIVGTSSATEMAAAAKAAAVSMTEGNIAIAASEAATAVAWFGPEAAAAAFASTAALLNAEAAPMLSASGGIERVSGVGQLALLHKDEQVWPAAFADRVRGMLDRADSATGGGRGGATYQITINAMDGASVRRVVESPDFARALSEARRNGRIP